MLPPTVLDNLIATMRELMAVRNLRIFDTDDFNIFKNNDSKYDAKSAEAAVEELHNLGVW